MNCQKSGKLIWVENSELVLSLRAYSVLIACVWTRFRKTGTYTGTTVLS